MPVKPIGDEAMRLPCVRFAERWMIVAAAVFVPVLFATPLFQEAVWVRSASVPLEFLILDSSTGRPINGASIRLAEGDPEYRTTTGTDGRATLVIRAATAGRSSVFRSTRSVNYGHWSLAIAANGYNGLNDDLKRHTLGPRYHSDAVPALIVIRLSCKPTKP
jgi:hypothetical protein